MLVGITGTLGAGKGTVAEYLVYQKGFLHFSVRSFLEDEIKKREMPLTRDSMVVVANDLRKQYSPSYIVEQLMLQAKECGKEAVIESIRAVAEAEKLKEMGAILLSVDADQKVRYERVLRRGSVTDTLTFEKFASDEEREMTSNDPTKQNISAVMELADAQIQNNSSLEELHQIIESVLSGNLTEKCVSR